MPELLAFAETTMPGASPYEGLRERSFWSTGVARHRSGHVPHLYEAKFPLAQSTRVAAAGSCFAQHVVRELRARHFNVLDVEPSPPRIDATTARRFGYLTYSARYGNVYTTRQLVQLLEEALGLWQPCDAVWERDGRFFDALRPSVEPDGLASPELVRAHREQHLAAVRTLLASAEVFVFTLGLTECWAHRESGTVFPTAPGTVAGSFTEAYAFVNLSVGEVVDDLRRARELLQAQSPGLRMLLTVSPVPLTATASADHVLVASSYSKAVLRAAAGELATLPDVDYFPSYEIITGPQSGGRYFDENLRTVRPEGVAAVMEHFFSQDEVPELPAEPPSSPATTHEEDLMDPQCEDALLEFFAP